MSYDESDAQRDAAYEEMYRTIYEEVRGDTIQQFSTERLKSYYIANPHLMRPAWERLQEAMKLVAEGHFEAATIFFAGSMELFFRFTLLRPVVYGLVHHERLADAISKSVLDGNTGFTKYTTLLGQIYAQLLKGDLKKLTVDAASGANLIKLCNELQDKRNALVHHGASAGKREALEAQVVAMAVFNLVVSPMLKALGLGINGAGDIGPLPAQRVDRSENAEKS